MIHLTDGAARILFSPGTSHLMVEESPSVRERERERVHIAEEEEESPKNHFTMAGIQTHVIRLLSQVL